MPAELSVSISEGLMDQLDSLASDTRRTREDLVVAAVQRLVEHEAPFAARMKRAFRESAEGLTVPHEEVVAWAESLGTSHPLPRPNPRKRIGSAC